MGIYLNPGNDAFQMSVSDDIYVDKSEIIDYINNRIGKRKRYICVSRPRRFGKSMTAEMLAAYYSRDCDSDYLFKNLKIACKESYKKHLNQYNVIYLNMQQFLHKDLPADRLVNQIENKVIADLQKKYHVQTDDLQNSLSDVLTQLFAGDKSDYKGFIFIIDEWDCIFRIARENTSAQKLYLDFLRDLFKDRTYVKFAYMTGILPIKKYGNHSALNDFNEYSMTNPDILAEYMGFTEEEVKQLCNLYNKDFDEVKYWYNGYSLNSKLHIYNPKSVVDCMQSIYVQSFWTSTETYEALQVYIDLDLDGLKQAIISMLSGLMCEVDTGAFQNDMMTFKSKDDVLTLLVHLGYLAYDNNKKAVYIPNEEVRREFLRAVKNGKHREIAKLIKDSDRLLEAVLSGEEQTVADVIEKVHDSVVAPDFYNNEQALRSVVRFAFLSSIDEFVEIQELPSGKGYADIVFLPKKYVDRPILLIELKWNKSADGAINQIKNRNYPQVLKNCGNKIILVGINYDSKSKKHICKIEKMF